MQYGGISIICTSGETQRPGIKRFGLEIESQARNQDFMWGGGC